MNPREERNRILAGLRNCVRLYESGDLSAAEVVIKIIRHFRKLNNY
jgi:hypothetical protein